MAATDKWSAGRRAEVAEPAPTRRSTRLHARQRRRAMVRLGDSASFTADVGGGGFCLNLMRILPIGAAVQGVIRVDGREWPFTGRVVWAKPGARNLNLAGRLGVHFTAIPEDFCWAMAGPERAGSPEEEP